MRSFISKLYFPFAMKEYILFDQAKVQVHNIFTRKNSYGCNDKTFPADQLKAIFWHESYPDFMFGRIYEKEFVQGFLDGSELDLSFKEYTTLFKSGIDPIEGMERILSALSKRFYLATWTNEGTEWANYKMDAPGFRKYFQDIIISGDIGMAKPDMDFYEMALEMTGIDPEKSIFIDDRKENCDAAKTLGIDSIVFENANQLKEKLTYFSINV